MGGLLGSTVLTIETRSRATATFATRSFDQFPLTSARFGRESQEEEEDQPEEARQFFVSYQFSEVVSRAGFEPTTH